MLLTFSIKKNSLLVLKRLSFINFLVNFLPSYYQLLFQSNTWFWNQSFRRIVISHVSNSSRILPLGSSLYCGRHVSHNALVFSRSISNKKRSATSFSQRLLSEVTPLLCYDQRIQVTAISSVFRCLSATLWCESSTKVRKFLYAKLRIVSLLVSFSI